MKKSIFISLILAFSVCVAAAYNDTGPKQIVKKSDYSLIQYAGNAHSYEISAMDVVYPYVLDICSTYGIAYEDMLTTQHAYRKIVKVENYTIEQGCGRSLGGGYLYSNRIASGPNS